MAAQARRRGPEMTLPRRPSPVSTSPQRVTTLKIAACAFIAITALCTVGYLGSLAIVDPLAKAFFIQNAKPLAVILLRLFSIYVLKVCLETIDKTVYTIAGSEVKNFYGRTFPTGNAV